MKSKIFIKLLSLVFLICILFVTPLMAQEPIRGMQLALRGINADDAEVAIDDPSPKNTQSAAKELKKDDSPKNPQQETKDLKQDGSPKSLEQEVKELKQEVQRIRSENEARKKLEIPEEEKSKSVEDILSAVGREYSLLKKGTIGLSYTLGYSYFSGDAISDTTLVEKRSNHNIVNIITAEYALFNNLTIGTGIPFAYKYNRVGTSSSQEATDLGDVSLSLSLQPFKSGGKIPTTILSFGASLPTGTSPYRVDLKNSLPTGSGLYSFSGGVSLSKVLDPLVAFGSLNYSYSLPEEGLSQRWGTKEVLTKVDPGSSLGLALGFGYALSYQASLNLGVSFGYSFGSNYIINNITEYKSGSSVSSSFNVGTGWRISPTRSIYAGLAIGLTNSDADFSFSVRLPFEF
ncbi:MAG: transporter [Deltaproteobacteria bacterium]|nr:transporter [Deltaproteobacteria bacterium]